MVNERVCACFLGAIIILVVCWGEVTKEQARNQPQLTAAPEFITTKGLVAPRDFQKGTMGQYGNISTYWAAMESDDWVLLNGPRGTATCQKVLGSFGYANANNEVMTSEQAQLFVSGFAGKPVRLQVIIPHFSQRPSSLDECLGFGYDAKSKMLTVGAKHVAYLAYSQPGLVQEK